MPTEFSSLPVPQSFTLKARESMETLHASEETIRATIAEPDAVDPAVSSRPGEEVVSVTKLDLHLIYNATSQVVIAVNENRNFVPNNPMHIERGHRQDRWLLRDLCLGVNVRLPDSLDRSERNAIVQRLRKRASAGKYYPVFEIASRDDNTWIGRRDAVV
jgi:hypothetical protein